MSLNSLQSCPCGAVDQTGPIPYTQCCQPLHQGIHIATSPEALMRSRYCAFVVKQYDYLIATQHPQYLDGLTANILAQTPELQWLSLNILSSQVATDSGEVCFQAWYRDQAGDIDAIHECSQFECIDGHWHYIQGQQFAAVLPKRNEPCMCNSGKKYKQCCLKWLIEGSNWKS